MIPTRAAKPTATATIEPVGRRTRDPRDHAISIVLELSTLDGKHADKSYVAQVAHRSLGSFPPVEGEPDRRGVSDVPASGRAGRDTVTGVEGSLVWRGRPAAAAVEALRAALHAEGYRVLVRERRECAEAGCSGDALVDWDHAAEVPKSWYSSRICGKHSYRSCTTCQSVYIMRSESSAGQAPSLHCQVCGAVLIEWGGSKLWEARLVARGDGDRRDQDD